MPEADACEQMDLFVDYETMQEWKRRKEAEQVREKKIQSTVLDIKRRFGKNAILKGTALEDGGHQPREKSEDRGAPGMREKYDDMLFLPHYVSAVHPQMPRHDRAASFLPLQP